MRQHLPLAATTVQIQERIEYLTHIELPGPASPIVAGRWHQGFHDCPLGIREIRGICLPLSVLLRHPYAPLCLLRLAPPFYQPFCQNQFPESLLEGGGSLYTAKTALQPVLDRLTAIEVELAPYEQIKTDLAAARARYR